MRAGPGDANGCEVIDDGLAIEDLWVNAGLRESLFGTYAVTVAVIAEDVPVLRNVGYVFWRGLYRCIERNGLRQKMTGRWGRSGLEDLLGVRACPGRGPGLGVDRGGVASGGVTEQGDVIGGR